MTCKIEFESLDKFALDAKNPRLGRKFTAGDPSQKEILNEMGDWSLFEIASSFLESGFWPYETVLCVKEPVEGKEKLVVVEGNRRLAALVNLHNAWESKPFSQKWKTLIDDQPKPKSLFEQIPFILLNTRKEIDAFLGFRHVTGIKEWAPAEKAEFISFLIDERNLTYQKVMRWIGSRTEAVRRNYISFRLLQQMEEIEEIDVERVENKFSVLFLSLRTSGVQNFLGINILADPKEAKVPVPTNKIKNLIDFSKWLFGDEKQEPIVRDSRQIDKFSNILACSDSVNYLKKTPNPNFETACKISGGELSEIVEFIEVAAFSIENALSSIHLYKDEEVVKKVVKRLLADVEQISALFPRGN